jgi:hypothetical protein
MAHLPNVVVKVTIMKVLLTIVKSCYFDCKTTMVQLKKPLLSIIKVIITILKSRYLKFKKVIIMTIKNVFYDCNKLLVQL